MKCFRLASRRLSVPINKPICGRLLSSDISSASTVGKNSPSSHSKIMTEVLDTVAYVTLLKSRKINIDSFSENNKDKKKVHDMLSNYFEIISSHPKMFNDFYLEPFIIMSSIKYKWSDLSNVLRKNIFKSFDALSSKPRSVLVFVEGLCAMKASKSTLPPEAISLLKHLYTKFNSDMDNLQFLQFLHAVCSIRVPISDLGHYQVFSQRFIEILENISDPESLTCRTEMIECLVLLRRLKFKGKFLSRLNWWTIDRNLSAMLPMLSVDELKSVLFNVASLEMTYDMVRPIFWENLVLAVFSRRSQLSPEQFSHTMLSLHKMPMDPLFVFRSISQERFASNAEMILPSSPPKNSESLDQTKHSSV